MEQIYYTQCPVGYGLGASNGFQIKRLSPGYPLAGDFRHLSLRAFPGGGRVLAPPVLRYRLDGEIAEVAWLTPRAHEYETERGLWGRPGGVFAHGLRLDPAELASIKRWPAGLFDSPTWHRTDREPSRGRPPDEISIGIESLFRPPTFADVASLAEGEDPEVLAKLLTAIATATREVRTLFLIDEPQRLGPRIALLTFAFPEVFRSEITFSTYHDRPEELPGFRLQGTTHASRPNKAALTSLGVVADMTGGTIEPQVEAADWARTLAGWFTRRDAVDEADWSATEARAASAKLPKSPESAWTEEWLGHLFGFPTAQRSRSAPIDAEGWTRIEQFARWSGRSGFADDWVRPRGAAWWLEAARSGSITREGRSALVAHVGLRDAWRGDVSPAAWGDAVALWFREAPGDERDDALAGLLQSVPRASRPAFARALLRGLSQDGATAVLDRLRDDPSCDRGTLLPLEASAAVAAIVEGADPGSLAPIIEEARQIPGALGAVLDAVEAGVALRPDFLPTMAGILASAGAFDFEGPTGAREPLAWALRRAEASTWLAPSLRPILADLGRSDVWRAIRDRTPEALRPALARALLTIAADPGLPDEPFRWGVEGLLLTMAPRPTDATWAETYLKRTPSDLELIRRLVTPEYRKLGVPTWLDEARARGEVTSGQAARIDNGRAYARSLRSGDARALLSVNVPGVPPEERGALLGQMLANVSGSGLEGLPIVLGACRAAWQGAFEPGAAGLRSLASPIARSISGLKLTPEAWLDHLSKLVAGLGLGTGFEPDSLAAEVVAATAKLASDGSWPLRLMLLRHPTAWRMLAADIRRELAESDVEVTPDVLARWDKQQDKPARFFEAFLNACDGPRIASAVSARSADLRSLTMSWWKHRDFAGSTDDLRDAYARLAPLAPIAEGRLFQVRNWIKDAGGPGLSAGGLARWRCLEALTNFRHGGADASARWPIVTTWETDLPLSALSLDDRHRFVAWLIKDLDSAETYQVARLAKWLRGSGIEDVDRVTRWAEELHGLAEVDGQTRIMRSSLVGDLKSELMALAREARSPRSIKAPARNREQT